MTANPHLRMVTWLQLGVWLVAHTLLLAAPKVQAQAVATSEYTVKAAFLFNFAQFIQWPAHAFPTTNAPLIIGIIGTDPFGPVLDEIVRGESVNGHPLVVQRYRQIEGITNCHILFVGESDSRQIENIFTQVKTRSILTVGDSEEFVRLGGMIGFFTEKNKIRLGINAETARQAGLEISSRLLRLAKLMPAKPH